MATPYPYGLLAGAPLNGGTTLGSPVSAGGWGPGTFPGSPPAGGGGLLGMQPAANPWLALGAGLLAGSAPSLTPGGFGRGAQMGFQNLLNVGQLREAQKRTAEMQRRTGLDERRIKREEDATAAAQAAEARWPEIAAQYEQQYNLPAGLLGNLPAKQGMGLLSNFVKPQEEWGPARVDTSTGKPILVQDGPGGKVRAIGSGGVTVNVGQGGEPAALADRPLTPEEQAGLGMSDSEAARTVVDPKGQLKKRPGAAMATAEEYRRLPMYEAAQNDLATVRELFDANRIQPGAELATKAKVSSTAPLSLLADVAPGAGLNEDEARAFSALEGLSNTLLALMRGAQVGPAEQARFEQQLPRPGQSRKLFEANLRRTEENFDILAKRAYQRMGEQPPMSAEDALRQAEGL